MTLEAKTREIIFFDNRMDYLHPVIEQWQDINLDYINMHPDNETYYWFNERANTSALAGAIWLKGGMVVEESSIRRGENSNVGRADLHFHYEERQVLCEVKHDWLLIPKIKQKNFNAEMIKKHLEAIEDISRTKYGREAQHYLGLTFITPRWTAQDCPTNSFEQLRQQLTKQFQTDLEVQLQSKAHLHSKLSFVAFLQLTDEFCIKKSTDKDNFNSIILIGSKVF